MKKVNGRYEVYGNAISESQTAPRTNGKRCLPKNLIMIRMRNTI